MPKVRLGIFVGNTSLSAWEADAIKRAAKQPNVEITQVVICSRDWGSEFYYKALKREGVWSIYGAKLLAERKLGMRPEYDQPKELGDIVDLNSISTLRCTPISREDIGSDVPEVAIETVKKETDILFRCNFRGADLSGILKGDILDAPKYGVWSFHHGDFREIRGRPHGFWEYLHGAETGGITLQQLSHMLDGGKIILERTIDISECCSWKETRKRLVERSIPMLAEGVKAVQSDDFEPYTIESLGPVYTTPGVPDLGRFAAKRLKDAVYC